jgi:RNA polymerase sigma-70 factor (ECF subfamily)
MEAADDELICRFRDSGDAQAFEALFHRHSRRVFNFARGMMGNAQAAEELLQETFLSVARSAKQYSPQGYFRTWLLRITRNLCLNAIQARKLRAVVGPFDGPLEEWRNAKAANPLLCAQRSEEIDALQAAIGRLPERQRDAILLYAFDDMQYLEIAQVLEVPVNTVKTLIHRARAALADEFGEDANGG